LRAFLLGKENARNSSADAPEPAYTDEDVEKLVKDFLRGQP
jgi:hypothetical protein